MIIRQLSPMKHILIDTTALMVSGMLLMWGAGVEFWQGVVILAVTEMYLIARKTTRMLSEGDHAIATRNEDD